ncbi:sensor domain-containing diguanylate cyclase [Silvibacterium acidisoli]|uniref:sensor domain-containing diguanylate cyclase n=1 Tax=Acidobacteriaceae bacterium ZG23-2 TaxID=2883246 RepID=UPI00406D285B
MDEKLADESGRLAALQRYEVLDTPREASFDRITSLVQAIFNVPIVLVSLVDRDRQWFKSCIGLDIDSTSRDISFCTYTIQAREPLHVPDALEDSRFATSVLVTGKPYIRSYLGIPLTTSDGYNVGSLCAIDTKPREYSAEQIQLLGSFASLVVDELELRRIAQTDSLTGAATRRGFLLEMEKLIARSSRNGRPNSLLLLDIDHFKSINDTHGHPAGDTVLRSVSDRLYQLLRAGDVLGRIGGEEFGVLLPDTDIQGAYETAERLRTGIAAAPLCFNPLLNVTASFGVCSWQPTYTADEWLAGADKALYEAKRTGRNRSCLN